MQKNIILTTMGTTWQILPELYGFTNPAALDLYRHHPERDRVEQLRTEYGVAPVEEFWVVTTGGSRIDKVIGKLISWHTNVHPGLRPVLRIWRLKDVNDLVDARECGRMREVIFRLALMAADACGDNGPLFSLTGGRKTMSSDLQEAAGWFGCRALVHVIDNPEYGNALRVLEPPDFAGPLPPETAGGAMPLVTLGRCEPSALLEMDSDGAGAVRADQWPLPLAENSVPSEIEEGDLEGPWLSEVLAARRRKAGYHYSQYTVGLIKGDETTNFLALYSLPPRVVWRLKEDRFGLDPARVGAELAWLRRLPKTDLHCHLGGIADAQGMITVAAVERGRVEAHRSRLDPWLADWRRRFEAQPVEELRAAFNAKDLRNAVPGVPEPLCVAAFVLLFEEDPDLLDALIFGPFRDEAAFSGIAFDPYERLGDLQGSGLLQSEATIRAACRILLEKAAAENVRYLEVRCSPINYTRGGVSERRVAEIIADALTGADGIDTVLIFTASRHAEIEKVRRHVELAGRLTASGNGFPILRGFDLAGRESACKPADMRRELMPMMERCIHFTIHAGEKADVGNIWEAVYHLNAERIGHGLTLKDNPSLMERFVDRRIALEMCPSSNFQIIGYRDNFLPSTRNLEPYPLSLYLEAGLRVTVNTDNPGISRTDPTRELHRAARLTPNGLSRWDICRIIRNGYRSAFADSGMRRRLLHQAEKVLVDAVQAEPTP